MQIRRFFAIGTAAWLISANSAFSEEIGATKAQAAPTGVTDDATQSTGALTVDTGPAKRRVGDENSHDWRRNDRSGARPGERPTSGRSSGGSSDGDGSDGGGDSD